jgi:subtilase family serine protease
MVGKVVDGNVVPLTLAKTGLNCYESPVNLTAGTYRVALTYALGHEDELIDNPLVVNGVPQSTYDFTFSGNAENEELVTSLLQFSFEEADPPVVEEVKSISLTDILLIVIVILIIVVAIVLILRARRS